MSVQYQDSKEELAVWGYIRQYFASINDTLPPDDIVSLFVAWIRFLDSFDQNKIHKDIEFDPDNDKKFKRDKYSNDTFASVVGTIIVEKGMKHAWKFRVDAEEVLVGIMNDTKIASSKEIGDFSSKFHEGYGLQTGTYYAYHDKGVDGHGFLGGYMKQFQSALPMIIIMELDMTQTVNNKGVLKYIVHNERKQDVEEIRTDGEYTNIAYDNIDIDTKYRLAIGIVYLTETDKWVELIHE